MFHCSFDGSDEESQNQSKPSFERGDFYSDPLEEFLSLPDGKNQDFMSKLDSSYSSTILIKNSLLVYCSCAFEMDCDNEGVGILYLCPGFSEKGMREEITASLSSNGTKLHIKLPSHHQVATATGINNETYQGSSNLVRGLFGVGGGVMASEVEVDLPLEENCSRVIISSNFIHSQDEIANGQLFLHLKFGEGVDETINSDVSLVTGRF